MLNQIQGKHLLIDSDIYAYRCAASAEKTKYLVEKPDGTYRKFETHKEANIDCEDGLNYIWARKEVEPLEFALQACKTAIGTLLDRLAPREVSFFLSPERTFRHDIARTKPYKGNRLHAPKPKYLQEVKEYLINEYGARIADNVEADDEIGIALSKDPNQRVSVSIDKDLLQVPGWHYDWVNDRVRKVSPRQGDLAFYTQLLTGDVTDNVPGCPGVGEKGAAKILDGVQSRADAATRVWGCYRGSFDGIGRAREYYLEQSRLLWILRGRGEEGKYVVPIALE